MSRRIIFSMIGAGAVLVGSASDASAFEMLTRMLGGGCCGPEPACGCAAEPSCGCEVSCCDPCCDPCGGRRGLLRGLFHRHRGCDSCCEVSCCEPACGCAG